MTYHVSFIVVTTCLLCQVLKAVVAQFNASQLITQRGKVRFYSVGVCSRVEFSCSNYLVWFLI